MVKYGYSRVSTMGQSLEAQLEQLQGKVDVIFQEKVSGAKRDRIELNKLLKLVQAGDSITVTKLDRLARSTKDLLEIVEFLESKKVTLLILNMNLDTSTPTGKLMLTMLGAIATFEREMMLERQAEGIARAKKEGLYTGRKPTARLQADRVKELRNSGCSLNAIAAECGISRSSVIRCL